ncbi:NADH dehydrogenase FAD-containing subunit [Arthrobacter sp. MYb23]|uniref:NAD(P)/FAD-dependent oxidoreductase n=1 Tax=unclassified Arthrobacter TaxID=235627 RepID=UPI000CFACA5B|nr:MULTISPECIES: NAD(P)/FAD-dependent oxidoreductase [unclassified Arthrobacter]PRB36069.1 NADH dehydrogenase FAD-containing subunit [Arthrobacter sp. MYb51]PRB90027.1 NADH dehydrogenase FAD-containing subunit [Arthrobacter sp. MYb23]
MEDSYPVIIVGAGFAGVAAAKELGRKGIRVLLIDSNNYHQFQPLLYQVATSQIGVSAIARPLRAVFRRYKTVKVLTSKVDSVNAAERVITTADGRSLQADVLVIAVGAVPNFFNTPGAEEHAFPLYSVTDATKLGSGLTRLLDQADRNPDGSVDVVVVGGGPTGVETAGAMAENVKYVVSKYFSPELAARCRVHLVDMVPTVLNMFSAKSQSYATDHLKKVGVQLHMGQGVTEVRNDGVTLADGSSVPGQIVVWAGGLKAGDLIGGSGLTQGRGGRVDVKTDLTAPGVEGVYVIGDCANITDSTGAKLPQLGSVAQQAGKWAASNILADLKGESRAPFRYVDKGYMAMVGRGAAVAELGRKRIQLQGILAFLSWLLVHLALLSGLQQKIRALFSWLNGYILHSPAQVVVSGPIEKETPEQEPPGP